MTKVRALFLGMAIVLVGAAGADDLSEELQRCAQLENAEVRLACYDALARMSASRAPKADAASPPDGSSGDGASATAPATPKQVSEPESDQSLAQRVFGLLPGTSAGENKIESRVVGEFKNLRLGTRFKLENGQVWQQTGQTNRTYRATNPKVEIKEGFMNSYRMRLEGLNARIRVRRVK